MLLCCGCYCALVATVAVVVAVVADVDAVVAAALWRLPGLLLCHGFCRSVVAAVAA